jgi:hypothetical protein
MPVEVDIFADEAANVTPAEVSDVMVEPEEPAVSVSVEPDVTPVTDLESIETLEELETISPTESIEPVETLETLETLEPVEAVEAVEALEPVTEDFGVLEPEIAPEITPDIALDLAPQGPPDTVFAPEPELAMPELGPEPELATNLLSPAPPPPPPPPPPRTAAPKRPGAVAGAPPTKPQMVKMEAPEANPIKQIRESLVNTGDLPGPKAGALDPTETFMVPPGHLEVLAEDDDTHTLAPSAPDQGFDSLDDDFELPEDGGGFDTDLTDGMDLDGLDDLDDDE